MNEELKIVIKAVTDSAQKAIKEVGSEIQGLSKSANGASGKIGAAFKGIAKGAAIAVAAVAAIGAALVALGKKTLQMNTQMAKLNTAFNTMGASAQQASKTYNELYRFLGDTDKAVEAASHLAKITQNEQELAEWAKIAQGVYATFGDSLPIEGLTEAANETIRVGQVTGTLADALNWAGVSEDEFNAKLAKTTSYEEREALVRSTLNGLYEDAANIYEKNNAAILAHNESQARLDASMAAAGAATVPLLTALNNLGAALFDVLKPAIEFVIPILADFINIITKGVQAVVSFFAALTGKSSSIKAVGASTAAMGNNISSAASGTKNLANGLNGAEKAAEDTAKALEEAKKVTMGFDELNIVSSGSASGSGGGGASGGGSGSPSYAGGGGSGIISPEVIGAEVTQSESIFTGFFDSVKETFAKLGEVFAPSISAWSGAFDTVKASWDAAVPNFLAGAENIKSAFSTLGGYLINDFLPNIINTFSTNIAPLIGEVAGFYVEEVSKQFEWLSEYLVTITNDVIVPGFQTVETVATDIFTSIGEAWAEHGAGFLEQMSGLLESLRTHIDNFYNEVFKPIWDKVLEVFNQVWENGMKPFVDNFINTCLVIGTELGILYNEVIAPIVDWIINEILPPIVKVLEGLIETIGKVATAIYNAVSGVIDVIRGIVEFIVGVFTGDWEKAWKGITDIFEGIGKMLGGIVDGIIAIFEGVIKFLADVLVAAFEIAWETIKGVWGVVVDFFQGIWDGIVFVFSAVGEWFGGVFSAAWQGIKDAFAAVGSFFSGVWEGIKKPFTSVASWFKDIFSKAWQAVKNVFSTGGKIFDGIKEGIANVFKTVVNGIIGGINKVIKVPFDGINSALKSIKNVDIMGLKPFNWIKTISVPQIPLLAKGGVVDSATLAMIGERGKEAVVPLENNTEWMDKLAEKLAARTSAPSRIVLTLDGKELGWANINSINSITKQTGSLPLVIA
jgi:phage-related protein